MQEKQLQFPCHIFTISGLPILVELFAVKYNYDVNMNQESFALGAAHIVGSTMSCGGLGISAPRLLMMESSGGKTQLSYVIAALATLIIVVFLASSASTLPACVVAVIIIASFGKSSSNFSRLRKYWRSDRLFFAMWVFTFSACTVFNISDGLLYGVIFSILVTAVRTVNSQAMHMEVGYHEEQKYYLPTKYYSRTIDVHKSARIVSVNGALFFGNSTTFKREIITMVKQSKHPVTSVHTVPAISNGIMAPETINSTIPSPMSPTSSMCTLHRQSYENGGFTSEDINKHPITSSEHHLQSYDHIGNQNIIILDFSGVPFIDTSTIRVLVSLKNELAEKYLTALRLCNCNVKVYDSIKKSRTAFSKLDECIYLTLEDSLSVPSVDDSGCGCSEQVDGNCDSDTDSYEISELSTC